MDLQPNPLIALGVLSLMAITIGLEALISYRRGLGLYNGRETLANLSILAIGRVFRLAFLGWQIFWLKLADDLAFFSLPEHWLVFVGCFIAVDFLHYLQHRMMHEIPVLWAFHEVHHSSPWLNFTTAFRLSWFTNLFGIFFYLPAVLLGMPYEAVVSFLAAILVYEFFVHTRTIGKLGVLDRWINTPSAHRVHHASNTAYLDKNYGGFFLVWDRIFGTFAAEEETPVYGVTSGFAGHNPFWLQVRGIVTLWRGRLESRG